MVGTEQALTLLPLLELGVVFVVYLLHPSNHFLLQTQYPSAFNNLLLLTCFSSPSSQSELLLHISGFPYSQHTSLQLSSPSFLAFFSYTLTFTYSRHISLRSNLPYSVSPSCHSRNAVQMAAGCSCHNRISRHTLPLSALFPSIGEGSRSFLRRSHQAVPIRLQ